MRGEWRLRRAYSSRSWGGSVAMLARVVWFEGVDYWVDEAGRGPGAARRKSVPVSAGGAPEKPRPRAHHRRGADVLQTGLGFRMAARGARSPVWRWVCCGWMGEREQRGPQSRRTKQG